MIEDDLIPYLSSPLGSRGAQSSVRRTHSIESSGIVAEGFTNLVCGVEMEARRVVEETSAEQWNATGWLRRWKLRRKMNREIAKLAAEKMPAVSSKALF